MRDEVLERRANYFPKSKQCVCSRGRWAGSEESMVQGYIGSIE